jgi:hypothetical protein
MLSQSVLTIPDEELNLEELQGVGTNLGMPPVIKNDLKIINIRNSYVGGPYSGFDN